MSKYQGYIYLIKDQKHSKLYVGQKTVSYLKSVNYFGSGNVIKSIIICRGTNQLRRINELLHFGHPLSPSENYSIRK